MDISLRVHRVSTHPVEVPVTYDGETAKAMLPELEVELVHEKGLHGSMTLHFRTQADIAAARDMFAPGSEVVVTMKAGASNTPADPVAADPAPDVINTDVSH